MKKRPDHHDDTGGPTRRTPRAPDPGGPSPAPDAGGPCPASDEDGDSCHARSQTGGSTAPEDPTPPAPTHPVERAAPFGLPMLAEVPELAGLLDDLRAVDRLLARAVDTLILLQDHSVAETATGVPLEQWLAAIGRRTNSDRRMLATAATTCRRLPSLHDGFRRGRVSWAQLRAVALRIERLPGHHDDRIDAEVAAAINAAADADPDALARVVGWALRGLEADELTPRTTGAPERDWVALQPRLDGTGGQLHGDFGAHGFAVLDAALADGPPSSATHDGPGADPDPVRSREAAFEAARRRASRLLDLCGHPGGAARDRAPQHGDEATARDDHGRSTAAPEENGGGGTGADGSASDPEGASRAAPQVLLRCELESLIGDQRLPGQLLTHLTGGVMHVDADTARDIAEAYGADVRLVLVDHGRIVGNGRRSQQTPGWVRDALLALHDTCSEPGCRTAARVCDTDHARPWHAGGATDTDNLAPLCATTNHRKESAGWRVSQQADGTRLWHHPRSGLTTSTLPATWQPPRDPPRDPDPPASGTDPGPGTAVPDPPASGPNPGPGPGTAVPDSPGGCEAPGDPRRDAAPPADPLPPAGADPPG